MVEGWGGGGLVGLSVLDHREQDIAASAGQADPEQLWDGPTPREAHERLLVVSTT